MSEENSDHDKQYEPTQKKLDDARKKGEFAKSADLTTAAGYAGFLIVAWASGASSLLAMGALLRHFLDRPEAISSEMFVARSSPIVGGLLQDLGVTLSPWATVPGLLALLVLLAQRGLVFAPAKLKPQASRLSVVKGFGNKFGRSGLFEFAKSLVKLSIYSAVLGVFLVRQGNAILGTLYLSPALATARLLSLSLALMGVVFIVALTIGLIDLVWQRAEHLRKNRMSRKEMTDEQKEAEGDPMMKQQRRQKAVSLAMNQMLADVPHADVVIVNPTHYAVALKWHKSKGQAPVCVAKGVDAVAERIRAVASEAGVPIRSDPPTARALFASIGVGEEITTEHYRAVAAAIRFAESLRRRASN
jgi:flagellar biosynthetic protein FlhB